MDIFQKSSLIATLTVASFVTGAADFSQSTPLSDADWDRVREHVGLLDKVSFLSSLLPVIMKHRDALELSDGQNYPNHRFRGECYEFARDTGNKSGRKNS